MQPILEFQFPDFRIFTTLLQMYSTMQYDKIRDMTARYTSEEKVCLKVGFQMKTLESCTPRHKYIQHCTVHTYCSQKISQSSS